jgi:hypothetical protein
MTEYKQKEMCKTCQPRYAIMNGCEAPIILLPCELGVAFDIAKKTGDIIHEIYQNGGPSGFMSFKPIPYYELPDHFSKGHAVNIASIEISVK